MALLALRVLMPPAPTTPSLHTPSLPNSLLAQVVESMRRRVDAGHLQLLRQRALLQQKQQLVARGEAVLAQHCRASWRRQMP